MKLISQNSAKIPKPQIFPSSKSVLSVGGKNGFTGDSYLQILTLLFDVKVRSAFRFFIGHLAY